MSDSEYKQIVEEIEECKKYRDKLKIVLEATKKGIVNLEDFEVLLFYCF